MRLTQHSDYALRLLMYLGVARDRLVTAQEIASAYGLSKNHLMKVILGLVHSGYVESVRGRSGGLRLARDPGKIGVGAVIRDTEEDFALVECMGPHDSCLITRACRLRSIMQQALRAYLAVLDQYTLADLLERPGPVARLLSLDHPANSVAGRTGRTTARS